MAVTVLPTGAVTLRAIAGSGPAHPESVVVGAPPQWHDGSDASYAELHHTDEGVAPLDPFSAPTGLLSVSLTIRCWSSVDNTVGPYLIPTAAGVDAPPPADFLRVEIAGSADVQIITTTPWLEFSSLESFAAVLTYGASLVVQSGEVDDDALVVYGVTLTVTTTDVALVEEPVTRLWPRDDSRGEMGSATRLYPPPRAGRVFGGYN